MALSPLTVGPARFRLGPWWGSDRTAYLVPLTSAPTITPATVGPVLDRLAALGYREVVTAALAVPEARALVDAGFAERERLHLLRHDLRRLPGPIGSGAGIRLRRARRRDVPAALAVDNAAFGDFWRLDRDGLADALGATPTARFRVARDRRRIVGYAVAGRAGTHGYLQRLAVAPDRAGEGIGSLLVHDALAWLRRRAASALVNTQESNERAHALYLRLGFTPEPEGLVVMRRELV